MVGPTEVVVRAQPQDRLAGERYVRTLRAADEPAAALQADGLELVQPGLDHDHRRKEVTGGSDGRSL